MGRYVTMRFGCFQDDVGELVAVELVDLLPKLLGIDF
jgi:hypothetical protein